MIFCPDLDLGPLVPVVVHDVEDEVVTLAAQVLPLQPPLLVDVAVKVPAQHPAARLAVAALQVHGLPGLVHQGLPLPLPEGIIAASPLVHHSQLVGAVQTQAQVVKMTKAINNLITFVV